MNAFRIVPAKCEDRLRSLWKAPESYSAVQTQGQTLRGFERKLGWKIKNGPLLYNLLLYIKWSNKLNILFI